MLKRQESSCSLASCETLPFSFPAERRGVRTIQTHRKSTTTPLEEDWHLLATPPSTPQPTEPPRAPCPVRAIAKRRGSTQVAKSKPPSPTRSSSEGSMDEDNLSVQAEPVYPPFDDQEAEDENESSC